MDFNNIYSYCIKYYVEYTLSGAVSVLTLDIDECLEDNGMCSHSCNNTFGSYQCSCPKDLSLALDLHNCGKKESAVGKLPVTGLCYCAILLLRCNSRSSLLGFPCKRCD